MSLTDVFRNQGFGGHFVVLGFWAMTFCHWRFVLRSMLTCRKTITSRKYLVYTGIKLLENWCLHNHVLDCDYAFIDIDASSEGIRKLRHWYLLSQPLYIVYYILIGLPVCLCDNRSAAKETPLVEATQRPSCSSTIKMTNQVFIHKKSKL